MPGVPYIDTPENIARLREILQGGRDFVESEPVRDIYGTSLSLYGIIRNGRGEATGVVEMDIYAGELAKFRRSVAAIAFIVAGVTFLIVVAMLHLFTEYLLVPIRRIHSAVRRVSAGGLDVEVHSERKDELGDLTRGVSAMVRSLASIREEQRRDKEQLSQLAFFDVLTGLLNRKSFYDRLEKSLSVAQRAAGHLRALLFLDLDNFKDVNDSLGHEIGDQVLRDIAVRISACVRASDYVFRPGGDEFTVLLSALSHETDAAVVAQKLIEAVSRPIEVQDHTLHLSLSVGLALFPRDAQSVEGLVRNADMALFDAKRQRSTYRFFTPQLHEQAVEKMQVVADLHRGLERGEFELYYQPIVAASGEVSGAEALLRWNHPQWGRQEPSRFIALAEEAGLIVPLGEWVIWEACRRLGEMSGPGRPAPFVSVNLSMRQLQEPSLVPAVDRILKDYRFARERLQFELTETLLMQSGQSLETLQALRELGVRLVIDDFGIGYSSLSRLKDLPLHALKVDRSFMAGLSENRKDRELVRVIVAIAHELELLVVAEGVEKPEQVELLKSLGCDAIQGEVYARPLPAADFLRFIEEFRAPGRPR